MIETAEIQKISAALSRMYRDKDADLFRSLCSDDFTVWHNFDQINLSAEQVYSAFNQMTERYGRLSMDVVRFDPLHDGFVQQHGAALATTSP
jgi:hypothetical protein